MKLFQLLWQAVVDILLETIASLITEWFLADLQA
jgi:hypothetical protein